MGSEGLFGIALEITLRLLPKPEIYRTVLAAYERWKRQATRFGRDRRGLLPGAMEIMDNLAIQAAEAAVMPATRWMRLALLIVELEGERVAGRGRICAADAGDRRVGSRGDQRSPRTTPTACAFGRGARVPFPPWGGSSPDYIVQDGVVPRSRLGEALREIERLSRSYGVRVANVFHAGDGNLHPLILYNGREAGALERAEDLAGEILHMCIRLGGSITGEHGVGMEKREYMARMFGEAEMDAMWAMRLAIDPQELADRGKVFPAAKLPLKAARHASARKSRRDLA